MDVWLEEEADQITFILQLNQFVSCQLDEGRISQDDLPLKTFVSEAPLIGLRSITWIEIVRALQTHFDNSLFCHVSSVLKGSKPISAEYSKALKHSYFRLKEDSVYAIKCVCYDPGEQTRPLLIRYPTEDIEVSNSFESGDRAPGLMSFVAT